MITTTLAVLALAGALNTGASPSPAWQTDYAQAMAVASAERKPMAVFIGHGVATPGRMIADGTIPAEAARLLKDNYVALYLDTDTKAGEKLATQFALNEGLVISSPGGHHQALRHSGSVGGTDLTQKLGKFADAGQPTTTVSTGAVISGAVVGPAVASGCASGTCPLQARPVSYGYPVGGCATGNCPLQSQPAGYAIPYGAGYAYPANPFGSSCPNGRCPNQP